MTSARAAADHEPSNAAAALDEAILCSMLTDRKSMQMRHDADRRHTALGTRPRQTTRVEFHTCPSCAVLDNNIDLFGRLGREICAGVIIGKPFRVVRRGHAAVYCRLPPFGWNTEFL